jgi:hypothetical protein
VRIAGFAARQLSHPIEEHRVMRNPIIKGSLLVALAHLPVVGCGGGNTEESNGVDDGKGGGSAASSGRGGTIGNGGTLIFGGTTGNGGSSSGTTGNGGSGGGCAEVSRQGNKAVVALYFMVDISGSMNCPVPEADPPCETDPGNDPMPSRWTEASQAYKDFFSSSAASGLWAGISFFSGNSCNEDDYGPDVEIDALPGNASALNAAVDDQDPGGNTPTVPSLTAAIDHARSWATSHTDQQAVVVYATDGYPRGCDQNNTIDAAVDVAADGLSGSPSILTYVLAIGPNLTDLGRVATAGGTDVIQINTGQDVGAQLIDALNDIRDDVVVDCAYSIPAPPAGQQIDYNSVYVRITSGSGEVTTVGRDDPSDSTCNGWQYDSPTAPTQITLCGDACDAVQSDPNAGFDVVFGCHGPVIEPP